MVVAALACSLGLAGKSPEDAGVRVTVFEVMFGEQADLKNLVLFLSVGEHPEVADGPMADPEVEVLRRLLDRGWEVEPGSYAAPRDKLAGVRDAKSGKRGIWFYVGQVEWRGPDEVTAYGEFWANGKSSEAAKYHLLRKTGAWKLVSRNSIRKS